MSEEEERRKVAGAILAEGEATGHVHRVVSDVPVDVYELKSGIREFFTKTEVEIEHQEHQSIKLPAGDYVSDRVSEYDHFAEEAKKVQD